jgi:hypothetical protein
LPPPLLRGYCWGNVAIDLQAFADALFKLAAVSPSEARESMERLEHLEDAAPTAGQAARYATIGAIAGPTVRVATNLIRKKKPFDFGQAPDAHGAGRAAGGGPDLHTRAALRRLG